jgi:hypothetical protein
MQIQSEFVREEKINFKKINVALMVILSNITFGIYIPYWILSRRRTFEKLSKENEIPFKVIKIILSIYVFFFIATILGPFVLTDLGLEIKNSIDYIFTFYGLGIIMYSVFRIRKMLNEYFGENVIKSLPLTFFHIWYLQYKINSLFNDRGGSYEKKTT